MYRIKERKNFTIIVQFPGHDTLQEKKIECSSHQKPSKHINPLHPLQLLHAPEDMNIEAVTQFTSRMQKDFDVALQQLNRARNQMMYQTDSQCRAMEYQEGDQVLLSTKHIRF